MGRFNPVFFAMLQKARDKKRQQSRLSSIIRRRRRKKTAVLHIEKMDFDEVKLHPAPKAKTPLDPPKPVLIDLPQRGKLDPIPPQIFRPDDHRGQDHYKKLEKVGEKKQRRRVKPIIVARASNSAAEGHKAVSAARVAAGSLNRAETEALDVYMGVPGRGSPDLV